MAERREGLRASADAIVDQLVGVRRLGRVIVVLAVVIVVLLGVDIARLTRINAATDSASDAAQASRDVQAQIADCLTPQGSCAEAARQRQRNEAEERRRDLAAQLEEIQRALAADNESRRAENAQLLAAVQDALRRLDAARSDRRRLEADLAESRRTLDAVLAELAAQRAEGVEAPPPSTGLCAALGQTGRLIGCP